MKNNILLKNNENDLLVSSRIYFSCIIIILFILLIVSRVFYFNIIEYEHYSTLAKSNHVKVMPVPPSRGIIYSRGGIILANNKPSFNLNINPEKIDDIDNTINKLKKIISISDSDITNFKKEAKKKRRFSWVPLRLNLTEEEVAIFSVNKHKFNAVDIVSVLNRYYPYGNKLAHTIGYVSRMDKKDVEKFDKSNYSGTTHIGKLGIEQSYENILHGKVGYKQIEINAQGRTIRTLKQIDPVPGKDIYLSIDLSLQEIAVKSLNDKKGAIVAIDPNNGDILAFASSPSYDPNKFVNGIDNNSYKKLINSKDKPLFNRPIQGLYPPGSTIKPFIGLLGLNEGIRKNSDTIFCRGWISLEGNERKYRDWKRDGHGHTDLSKAIAQSCDVYFYTLAEQLGIESISQGLSKFGFGKKTDIDVLNDSRGLVPSKKWKRNTKNEPWYKGDTLILGIGQGFISTTPLQLAKATALLANKGKSIIPRFAIKTYDPITEKTFDFDVNYGKTVKMKNEIYWDNIISSMIDVVHSPTGTARLSGLNAKYKIAGKTGTSQVIKIAQGEEYKEENVQKQHRDHALFIAFAPAEKPSLALAIVVENGGGGGSAAAPIAREIFDHFMYKYGFIN